MGVGRTLAVAFLVASVVLTSASAAGREAAAESEDQESAARSHVADPRTPLLMPSGAPEVLYKMPTCYGQVFQWYKDIEAKYPDYFETYLANQKYGHGGVPGRGSAACAPQPGNPYDILYGRITNEKTGLHKPEVLLAGPVHGDEQAGVPGNYWFVDWFFRTAFDPLYADPVWTPRLNWYIENREIYVSASQNPYGFDQGTRGDVDGDDLNRETDYDCCGATGKGVWGSIQGKTVRDFVEKHQVRTMVEWHSGARALLHAFASTHNTVTATSPISGRTTTFAPADFYYFNVGMHRAGEFIGNYGGALGASAIGTSPDVLGYQSPGSGIYYYAGDQTANPIEAQYVKNGPYKGPGIGRVVMEVSTPKIIPESSLGGDVTRGYGPDMRRLSLYMIDTAQPYLLWHNTSLPNGSAVNAGEPFTLKWVVGGALNADNTLIQYGKDPDPIANPSASTKPNTQNFRKYQGGTVWDGAKDGVVSPYVWTETLTITEPGDYYFAAKSMVDQVYDTVAGEAEYGKNHTYLRAVKERAIPGWSETIQGEDGPETMSYHQWWYSPVLKVTVGGDNTPPTVVLTSPADGAPGVPTNAQVVVTFSEAMDTTSAEGAFSLNPAATGTFSWDAAKKVMTLDPSANLQPSTAYTGTVGTGAKDPAGNAMASPKTWTFTTAATADIDPPRVISTDPLNGATGVSEKTTVRVTFNESMDKPTVEVGFSLAPVAAGSFAWPSADAVVFTPSADLRTQTSYTIKVAATASDPAGNKMVADYTGSFTTSGNVSDIIPPTVISTVPTDGAIDVPLDQTIEVKFSELMDHGAVENSFFITPTRIMAFSWNGETLLAKPDVKYDKGRMVSIGIGVAAKDVAGNSMVQPYTFSFKPEGTGTAGLPPKVRFTIPADKATEVALDTPIQVAFTQDMSASSLTNAIAVSPALTLTVSSTGALATVNYAGKLQPKTKYTVTVSKEASSTESLTMGSAFVFTFTTGDGSAGGGGTTTGPTQTMSFLPFVLIAAVMMLALMVVAALFSRRKKLLRQWQQSHQQQQSPPPQQYDQQYQQQW